MQELLSAGADITRRTYQGRTPLMLAARSDHVDIVEELLHLEGTINDTDSKGSTALHIAAEEGCVHTFNLLSSASYDVNAQNKSGDTALGLAAQQGHYEIVALLLKLGAKTMVGRQKMNPLHWASEAGHLDCIKLLVTAGLDVNERTRDLVYTPRSVIVAGTTALILAARGGNQDIVSFLIENGASIDVVDEDGMTALLYTVKNNNYKCLHVLVESGADIDGIELHESGMFSCDQDVNPLFLSVKENNTDVLKQLLCDGCNTRVMCLKSDNHIMTILDYCLNKQRITCTQLLLLTNINILVTNSRILDNFLTYVSSLDEDLASWFFEKFNNVPELQHLCRHQIRSVINYQSHKSISTLPLPNRMLKYLQYDEFWQY